MINPALSTIYDSDYVKPHETVTKIGTEALDFEYNYSKSTTDNHCWKGPKAPSFVGKYAGIRQQMDYSYHKHYSAKRQYLHDKLIDESLYGTNFNLTSGCEKLEENWLVFTAGTMVSLYLWVIFYIKSVLTKNMLSLSRE